MSTRACRRVNICPDYISENSKTCLKNNSSTRLTGNRRRVVVFGVFRLRRSSSVSSPMSFLQRLSSKVTNALRLVSLRRSQRTSPKVSSSYANYNSNNYSNLERSRSYATHQHRHQVDSHHSEAIEDCIQFINSSSSFQRSNSVSASS